MDKWNMKECIHQVSCKIVVKDWVKIHSHQMDEWNNEKNTLLN
jgi:hypothetical protein